MTDLQVVRYIGGSDRWLAVVATPRRDGSIQGSVVNAGVLAHPVTGGEVAAFVTYGRVKLANLRARPQATLVWRAGWDWVTVEGNASVVGSDDPLEGFDSSRLPKLLRDVFVAAGGTHDDWRTYDRVMAEERRAAVLLTPTRIYSNRHP